MNNDKRVICFLVFSYGLLNAFFNNYQIRTSIPNYGAVAIVFFSIAIVIYFSKVWKYRCDHSINGVVSKLLLLFLFSLFWAFILWGQMPWESLITMASAGGVFPLIIYFIFQKYKFTVTTLVKFIIIIYTIYVVCLLIGLATLPTPVFGYTANAIENMTDSMEQRGVIRLGVPGPDFVVLVIFLVLTRFREKKVYYLLLIPLVITLLMRGTRTPFFATVLIGLLYYLWQIKHKWIAMIVCVLLYIGSIPLYQTLLNSDSNNAVVKYVQMTSNQIERSKYKEEDIRIEMAKYMFTKFDEGKFFRIIFGNGYPGYNGKYANVITQLGEKRSYYPVDTAFTTIYVYFGIIGLVLYAYLFIIIVRTKVTKEGIFAKLYVFYLFLLTPTNCSLVTATTTLAIALYIINKTHISNNLRENNKLSRI